MRGLDGRQMRTRIKGKAAIVRSLRGLYLRVYRFGTLRAVPGSADYRWALETAGALQALIPTEHGTGPDARE